MIKKCVDCGVTMNVVNGNHMRCGNFRIVGSCAYIYARKKNIEYQAMLRKRKLSIKPKRRYTAVLDTGVSDWLVY